MIIPRYFPIIDGVPSNAISIRCFEGVLFTSKYCLIFQTQAFLCYAFPLVGRTLVLRMLYRQLLNARKQEKDICFPAKWTRQPVSKKKFAHHSN